MPAARYSRWFRYFNHGMKLGGCCRSAGNQSERRREKRVYKPYSWRLYASNARARVNHVGSEMKGMQKCRPKIASRGSATARGMPRHRGGCGAVAVVCVWCGGGRYVGAVRYVLKVAGERSEKVRVT